MFLLNFNILVCSRGYVVGSTVLCVTVRGMLAWTFVKTGNVTLIGVEGAVQQSVAEPARADVRPTRAKRPF